LVIFRNLAPVVRTVARTRSGNLPTAPPEKECFASNVRIADTRAPSAILTRDSVEFKQLGGLGLLLFVLSRFPSTIAPENRPT
jgi:hypothetical protein